MQGKIHLVAVFALASLLAATSLAAQSIDTSPQSLTLNDWPRLIEQKKCETARTVCTEYVYSSVIAGRVGAQLCLAQVALCTTPQNQKDSILHLNTAMRLAPTDLNVHVARLHMLESTGNYKFVAVALEDSCNVYKGADGLPAWMKAAEELMDAQQYAAGFEVAQVIDKHFPNTARVQSYLGQFSSALGRHKEAIAYMTRAIALGPHDPDIAWQTARVYDAANEVDLANHWYQKALPMTNSAHQLMEDNCVYAQFLETKEHDRRRACPMERMSCELDQQTACGVAKPMSITQSATTPAK
jgi:hypothetical protein